jgi:DNA anti-recombination protein RmuC
VQLRRVVELAGMAEHCDFETQVSSQGEDSDGDARRMRPVYE